MRHAQVEGGPSRLAVSADERWDAYTAQDARTLAIPTAMARLHGTLKLMRRERCKLASFACRYLYTTLDTAARLMSWSWSPK